MALTSFLAVVPLLAAVSWGATLVTLLVLWLTDGRPKYKITSPDITYISGVGSRYDEVFIIGASATAFFFVLTLFLFMIFHRTIYKQNAGGGKPRTWADFLAFIFGMIASAGLVLLSIFDSVNHESEHWVFTLIFAFGAIICAIFNVIGLSVNRWLQRRKRSSFIMKILFIVLSTLILAGMLALMLSCSADNKPLTPSCNTLHSISAVLEWSLAVLFLIFILTWIIDFL